MPQRSRTAPGSRRAQPSRGCCPGAQSRGAAAARAPTAAHAPSAAHQLQFSTNHRWQKGQQQIAYPKPRKCRHAANKTGRSELARARRRFPQRLAAEAPAQPSPGGVPPIRAPLPHPPNFTGVRTSTAALLSTPSATIATCPSASSCSTRTGSRSRPGLPPLTATSTRSAPGQRCGSSGRTLTWHGSRTRSRPRGLTDSTHSRGGGGPGPLRPRRGTGGAHCPPAARTARAAQRGGSALIAAGRARAPGSRDRKAQEPRQESPGRDEAAPGGRP